MIFDKRTKVSLCAFCTVQFCSEANYFVETEKSWISVSDNCIANMHLAKNALTMGLLKKIEMNGGR